MAHEIPEQVQRIVKEQIASGRYSYEEEVLLAALQSLKVRDEEIAAIEEGIADVRAGRTELFDKADANCPNKRPAKIRHERARATRSTSPHHPRQHDPQFLRGLPLTTLTLLAHPVSP